MGSEHVAFVKSTGVSTETGAASILGAAFPKRKPAAEDWGPHRKPRWVQLWEGDSPFQVTGLWTTGCRAKMQPFPEKAPGGLDGTWWWEPEGRGPGASTPTGSSPVNRVSGEGHSRQGYRACVAEGTTNYQRENHLSGGLCCSISDSGSGNSRTMPTALGVARLPRAWPGSLRVWPGPRGCGQAS